MNEHITHTELISANIKCSFFGSKETVHLAVNFTSDGNFLISYDTPYYDESVKCYKSNKLEELCAAEIEVAKKKIYKRLEDEQLAHEMKLRMERKKSDRLAIIPREHQTSLHLFKQAPKLPPREVRWRD